MKYCGEQFGIHLADGVVWGVQDGFTHMSSNLARKPGYGGAVAGAFTPGISSTVALGHWISYITAGFPGGMGVAILRSDVTF